MVARLLRLRLALLGGAFRGSFATGLRTLLVMIMLAAIAVGAALLPMLLASGADELARLDTVICGLILALVIVVPFFARSRMLSARQFSTLPAKSGAIAAALLVTGVLTWPFFLLLVWLVSLGVLRTAWHENVGIAVAGLALIALLALTGARLSSGLSYLLIGERGAGRLRAIGWVFVIAALPVLVFAGSTLLFSAREGLAAPDSPVSEVARQLSWLPLGAPIDGVRLVIEGDLSQALIHFGVAAAAVVVFILLWMWVARASNERIERPTDPAIARSGLGWFERFSARPASVIAARGLTYWSRDARYRIALVAIPFAPFLMLLALWVAGVDMRVLALIPLPVILFLFGWSQHNDVAMDSTAIWMHVVSGTRGRADRAGRILPVLLVGVPIALIGSSLTVTLLGDWRVLPAVLGMNIGVLFAAAASTTVFSVLMPYPVTRPGDSPFVQPQWQGSGSGASQTFSILTALILSIPPLWISIAALVHVDIVLNLVALAVGVGWGLFVLGVGILIGGWIFDRSGPELIAVTQVFD